MGRILVGEFISALVGAPASRFFERDAAKLTRFLTPIDFDHRDSSEK